MLSSESNWKCVGPLLTALYAACPFPNSQPGIAAAAPAVAARRRRLLHVPDRTCHVTALVLRHQRMARPLELPDVRIVAHENIDIAIGADFLEEAHVTGMEPVVTTGHHNFLCSRRGYGWRRFGKTFQLFRAENSVLPTMTLA